MDILNIVLDLMRLVAAGFSDMTKATQELVYADLRFWFQSFLNHAGEAIAAIGNMIFTMIFDNSPLGTYLKEMLSIICTIVRFLVNDIWVGFMCPMLEKLAPPILNVAIFVLELIISIIDNLNKLICILFGCISTDGIELAKTTVKDILRHIENGGLNCQNRTIDECFGLDEEPLRLKALPVSTPCWTGSPARR